MTFFRTPSWALMALTTSFAFTAGGAVAIVAWFATDPGGSPPPRPGYYAEQVDQLTAPTSTETPPAPPALPAPSDFAIEVKVLSKKCFGSAGCSVDFSVAPSYIGATPLSPDVSATVTYEMVGTTDPQLGSFTVTGTTATAPKKSYADTPDGFVPLTARVTEVF